MSTPTCQGKWYDRLDPDDFYVCGEPASHAAGVIRSCGCPPTPVKFFCDRCVSVGTGGDCAVCGAHGVLTFAEPVRLKAAS